MGGTRSTATGVSHFHASMPPSGCLAGLARLASRDMPNGTMTNHMYEPDRWLMLAARLLLKQDALRELERESRERLKRRGNAVTSGPELTLPRAARSACPHRPPS